MNDDASPELRLKVVWEDIDVLELEVVVRLPRWAGVTTAYVTRSELRVFGEALQSVADNAAEATLQAGQRDLGWANLRVYEYGRARSLALTADIGYSGESRSDDVLGDQVLRVRAGIERGSLAAFGARLCRMATESSGAAALSLLPDAR